MTNLEKKIKDILEKIKKYFVGSDALEHAETIRKKQILNKVLLSCIVITMIIVSIKFFTGSEEDPHSDKAVESLSKTHETIELATEATKGEVKWQNFLEESIEEEGNKRQKQLDILKSSLETEAENHKNDANKEITEIKARLSFALNEIDRLQADNQNIQNDIAALGNNETLDVVPSELSITQIVEVPSTKAPVSSFNHIPATSYVSGHLLGGIAVSTSVNSASEPIPVIIKLTGKGNLPSDFAVDIKECRLLASCYGDISSERAIIRAEELVCENKTSGLIISTKVAGVIYGDDGANGIRGTVVSMSEKHLKNAFIGGVLSGFSTTAKGQSAFDITSVGAISSKKQGMSDMAKDGFLGGTSSAAEKLADYHIKLAENISPVILVPGGTKVDVMFTKSVEIGSFDVETTINQDRSKNNAR